ncbi:hypothetical protein QR680_017065 [Steinernema hermaphroditum]|uniref:Uncharacterized protein n=1 Tax=Steinernema hermaphroditum TaxID=289476 RepID=A0AA39HDN7_9BILA|nr:hypothetical protein QR680_017065 [Steinernema hermaphroditum]
MGQPTASHMVEEPQRCCFGIFVVQSTCISMMIFELLLLSHSLIFTATNLATGPEKYTEANSSLAQGLSFEYLTPLLVIQAGPTIFWVLTDLVAILAVKIALHYLMIPYLVLSLVAVLAAVGLISKFFVSISHLPLGQQIEWPLILAVTLLSCFIVLELYFLSVKLVCFRALMRKRKAVQASDGLCRKTAAADKAEDQWSSYSRRSTVIVTDDYLDIPA